jgi:tyrosine-protein kinase Etk/Wzc
VRVIDSAIPTYLPVKPKKTVSFILISLLGAMLGSGLVLLRRMWSHGIKDPKILESKFGLPVFATIPHSKFQRRIADARRRKDAGVQLLCVRNQDELTVEAFRSLRTTLHFSMHDSLNNVLLLTGASPNIGKSFVTSNLAVVLAQAGKKVCLVDADMRRGSIHDDFGLAREVGLSDYLAGKATFDEIQKQSAIENLTVITTGLIPPNASELLLGKRTEILCESLSGRYDYVLIDSPPILAVADAMVLAQYAGTTLLVMKHGSHPVPEIELTLQRLEHSGVKVKGAIFNDVATSDGKSGYGYGYTYQYKYGKKK